MEIHTLGRGLYNYITYISFMFIVFFLRFHIFIKSVKIGNYREDGEKKDKESEARVIHAFTFRA